MPDNSSIFLPGLVSVTFRQLTPWEVITLAQHAGLIGIEWGGDVHVPHGDLARADAVGNATRYAGLAVAAYGSYYRVGGAADGDGPAFEDVLASAVALGAPLIRVWAGNVGSADADDAYRARVAADTARICDLASREGIEVAYEYHGGTLTDTIGSALRLLRSVGHPNLRSLWQPRTTENVAANLAELDTISPWLANVHVFHWPEGRRAALAEGEAAWRQYLSFLKQRGVPTAALIEFVKDDDPEQLAPDAAALRSWIGE
jgi:3-dehydroshikimate dehydratase